MKNLANDYNLMFRLVKLILIILLMCLIFWPTFVWMKFRFSEPESFYAHGFLIPFVFGYLVFKQKEELKALNFKTAPAGIVVLILSLLLHLFAYFFEINFLSGFSLIGVFCGLILYNCGLTFVRQISFPLFFLMFMIPLPKAMTLGVSFHLKLFAANIASFIVSFIVPLKSANSMVYLPNGVLTVGAPCSGLKSLITLSALSLLFAHLSGFNIKRKIIFFICSIPIAILSNIVRIMLLIIVFYVYGSEVTMGWFHDFSGFLIFVIAFIGLAILRKLMLLWPEK